MTDPFSLEGQIILVTGASRGIGFAMAREMARAGGRVVLNGRHAESVEARAGDLAAEGFAAETAPFDVSDASAAAAALGAVVERHGRLDVLVCNAGINHRVPLDEFATDDWQRIIDTNLTACFVLAREAARPMVAQASGRIIMTASISARLARPTIPAYVAAKGGLEALTRALAVELGPKGVTCNSIAPGFVTTAMTAGLAANAEFDAFVKSRTPLGRWGRPEEIAAAAVFLASPAASYVNGHMLTVDGGYTAAM